MRRTITTLMFLAVGGLALHASGADHSRGTSNWQYYAAGQNGYRVSDEDDAEEAASPAAEGKAFVKTAAATQSATRSAAKQPAGSEKNALYVPELSGTVGTGIAPTNYLGGSGGGGSCGCGQPACSTSCGCGQSACGGGCMGDCGCGCSSTSVRLEYLMWFSRGRNTPALVTSSPPGTARADAGVLGRGGTDILYGGDDIGEDIRNGGRITLSHTFANGITSADVRFWGVEDSSDVFAITSANRPIIARPFNNVGAGIGQDSFLVAFPGVTDPGSIRVLSKNDLFGGDAYIRKNLWDDCCGSFDILGGYQFGRLDDSIEINSTSTSVDPLAALPVGSTIGIFDSFRTQNEFHGASVGFLGRSYRGAITLEALAKVAIGNMRQRVNIDGDTTLTVPGGGTTNTDGGLLAQGTNIGSRERNRIAYVPELNLNVVYEIDDAWRLIGGYSFIYFSNVVLAGNQIDPSVNLTQNPGPITGPELPSPRIQRTDFWVQGLNLGAEYRW